MYFYIYFTICVYYSIAIEIVQWNKTDIMGTQHFLLFVLNQNNEIIRL